MWPNSINKSIQVAERKVCFSDSKGVCVILYKINQALSSLYFVFLTENSNDTCDSKLE